MNIANLNKLLDELEATLVSANMWSEIPPNPASLDSQVPFACDVLPLEQWLQFIFIPKMRCLLSAGIPLPAKLRIQPIAEQQFITPEQQKVLPVILAIDSLFSSQNNFEKEQP